MTGYPYYANVSPPVASNKSPPLFRDRLPWRSKLQEGTPKNQPGRSSWGDLPQTPQQLPFSAMLSRTFAGMRPAIFTTTTNHPSPKGRHSVKARWPLAILSFIILIASSACTSVGLTLLAVGAGTTAAQGISYALNSVAYKTFTAPVDNLESATFESLERMDITVKSRENVEGGMRILAQAWDREIDIELDSLTTRTSRMRVDVKRGWFLRDRPTAVEIISQTAQALEDQTQVARPMRPPARATGQSVGGSRARWTVLTE